MTTQTEPNPTTRKNEDFPKTTTIPAGWETSSMVASSARAKEARDAPESQASGDAAIPVPVTGTAEDLFTHRLEPFPSPTDLNGMYL